MSGQGTITLFTLIQISTRYHQKRLDYYAAMNGFANNEESWEKVNQLGVFGSCQTNLFL